MQYNVITTTSHGMIIERPKNTFEIERALLPTGVFHFAYNDRKRGHEQEYDTRYLHQYRYPHVYLAGWWQSYYGYFPYSLPIPVLDRYPFHQPWLLTNELDAADDMVQRKPIPQTEQQGCWWAVELSTHEAPTLAVPDLMARLPQANIPTLPASPLTIVFDGDDYLLTPDPRISAAGDPNAVDDLGYMILSLPLHTLAGLAKRKTIESIVAWAWAAARWITANPTDELGDDWLDGLDALHRYKWAVLLGETLAPG